jgi:putative ABC transport system permease protein
LPMVSDSARQWNRQGKTRPGLGFRLRRALGWAVGPKAQLLVLSLALGASGTFALRRVLTNLLFGTDADPLSYSIVTILLICLALVASYFPARRAAQVDPVSVLRGD